MIDYFERILRFKDMEVWDIHIEKDLYRMFIFDENRPTEYGDLDLPNHFQPTEEDLRANIITVQIYSKYPVKDEHIETLNQFSKQLTNHVALAHCYVAVSFLTGKVKEVFNSIFRGVFST